MKKWLWLLLPLMPGALYGQQPDNFEIKGRLVNVTADVIYLSSMKNGSLATDTAHVRADNTYVLKGTTPGGEASLLRYNPETKRLLGMAPFFLSAESFEITHTQSFSNITVTGSTAMQQYRQVNETAKGYNAKIKLLEEQLNAASSSGNTKETDRLQQQLSAIKQEKLDKAYASFIKMHPSSPVAVYALKRYTVAADEKDAARAYALYEQLSPALQENYEAQELATALKAKVAFNSTVAIGRQAPDFAQADTAGQPVKLSSFRGKYVLLDFWASWCGPCRADNPNIVKAYQQYHDKGFEILSVSLDQPGAHDKWVKAIHDDHLTWTHVSDLQYWKNAVVALYGIRGIPQNFLIDPQGKIIARSLRGEDLDKQLKAIYNQ
ncbi:AhpC/TSA family protein [Chitinophaga agrisoli]|uniref:AhpC/TSA family protein n=1 Tax=Chitinophaga agrisoli TaxID=2607653 RepID=A0A5B2VIU3_9BACT|nr:TlpA disulfide reductase family protein [Chitinophaga agrisoli]KAA2238981.1 AhpC/TSA family protein [Chitinophaga agrisoli]